MQVNNSITSLLGEFISQHNNSIAILKSLSDVLTSSAEVVQVDLKTPGTSSITKLSLPTISSLNARIVELQTNIESITGISDGTADIRLNDGTFRRIFVNTLKADPKPIGTLNVPGAFDIKGNYFFENLLNPLLYVSYDLTGQVTNDVSKLNVRRYVIIETDSQKIETFDEEFKGRSDVSLDQFVDWLISNNVQYILDEDIIFLPPRKRTTAGQFSVIKIYDESTKVFIDGVEETQVVRKYQLDSLKYNDLTSPLTRTETLKIGDSLIVNSGNKNTRYTIISIDQSTLTVELRLVEGLDPIKVGANTLEYWNESDIEVKFDLPVNIDERLGVFVKPIDNVSNLASSAWNPGNIFYTNELVISTQAGELLLEDYYRNYVIDYGNALKGLASERIPSLDDAIIPDVPVLDPLNFKTVIINQHQINGSKIDNIKKLQNEKNRLQAETDEINIDLARKKTAFSTKVYQSENDRLADEAEIKRLESLRDQKNTTFKSVVNEISGNQNDPEVLAEPKYRLVGFWPMPADKISKKTADQKVVQFEVQYRYLNLGGNGNPIETFNLNDSNGNSIRVNRTTWETVFTPVRNRVLNELTGLYEWGEEDLEDPDAFNTNQVEIPIRPGESIEIRIKSISEAGYPINPAKSEFSESITVPFDDSIIQENPVDDIIADNQNDLKRVQLMDEISGLGLIKHITDSFVANENYFAHSAKNLSSGFLSPEQKPISVFDKLVAFEQQLSRLVSIIEGTGTGLIIKLIDELGNVIQLKNGQVNEVFVGYYKDLAQGKGDIISKTYFLSIENPGTSDVLLKSPFSGSFEELLTSGIGYSDVPLINSSFSTTVASEQRRGQWIYARSSKITKSSESYFIDPGSFSSYYGITPGGYEFNEFNAAQDPDESLVMFSGSDPVTSPGGAAKPTPLTAQDKIKLAQFHLSILNLRNATLRNPLTFDSDLITFSPGSWAKVNNWADLVNPIFRNNQESQFSYNSSISGGLRLSYIDEDRYLVGEDTVGAFIYPLIKSNDELYVGGSTDISYKTLKPGVENALQIPIIFEARLTDYTGTGDGGTGLVNGQIGSTNVTYSRGIGFDVNPTVGSPIKFDIKFTIKYKQDGASLQNIPSRDFNSSLNQVIQANIGT